MKFLRRLIQKSGCFYQTQIRQLYLNQCMNTINKDIVESLERLALVDFSTDAGIKRLEQSIKFADKLMEVDTSGVDPLISTVYDRNDNLREDEAIDKSCRKELMKIAPVSEEFYYVAPSGEMSWWVFFCNLVVVLFRMEPLRGTYTKKQNNPNS